MTALADNVIQSAYVKNTFPPTSTHTGLLASVQCVWFAGTALQVSSSVDRCGSRFFSSACLTRGPVAALRDVGHSLLLTATVSAFTMPPAHSNTCMIPSCALCAGKLPLTSVAYLRTRLHSSLSCCTCTDISFKSCRQQMVCHLAGVTLSLRSALDWGRSPPPPLLCLVCLKTKRQ